MSEWLKEHAWKACVGETLPWVRIPLSPPILNFFRNPEQFHGFRAENGVSSIFECHFDHRRSESTDRLWGFPVSGDRRADRHRAEPARGGDADRISAE